MFTNGRMTTPGREGGAVSEAQEAGDAIAVPAWMSRGADWISTSRDTSATKPCHALSSGSPRQRERSAVWVSSKMIGRWHASIVTGTSVRFRSAWVVSART